MSIRRVKTITAGILLGIGVPITIACTMGLLTANQPQNPPSTERADIPATIATLFFLGLMPTGIGGWLVWGNSRQGQQQARDRLQAIFFKLLRESNGHINVLRFSMEANISGEAAKAYLDERAREFNAAFNVSEEGKLFYTFDAEFNQPWAGALPGQTAGAETYDVVLEFFPNKNKREVVKVLKDMMGLEWPAAQGLAKQVRSRPVAIAQNVNRTTAEAFRQELEAVGARVLIVLR
jgi:ribosomal protein L7/L12